MRVPGIQEEKILTDSKSYDLEKLPNLYTGPADNGVIPLESNPWPAFTDSSYVDPSLTPTLEEGDVNGMFHSNPLVASIQGLDGRSDPGTIDDYWFSYNSNEIDPYTGNEEGLSSPL